jgi:hypothetical protein
VAKFLPQIEGSEPVADVRAWSLVLELLDPFRARVLLSALRTSNEVCRPTDHDFAESPVGRTTPLK